MAFSRQALDQVLAYMPQTRQDIDIEAARKEMFDLLRREVLTNPEAYRRLRDKIRRRSESFEVFRSFHGDERRAERYLEHFDSIWRLQSYLLSEADRMRVPIIVNNHREQVIRDVMNTIVGSLSAQITAEPREVFA